MTGVPDIRWFAAGGLLVGAPSAGGRRSLDIPRQDPLHSVAAHVRDVGRGSRATARAHARVWCRLCRSDKVVTTILGSFSETVPVQTPRLPVPK
jgi:hypothetical protein